MLIFFQQLCWAGKPGYQERLSLTDGLRLDVETERRRNLRPRGGNRPSSIPGSAVVFTAIQPWDSALVASDDMRAVLPVPRAPEKRCV